jgi:hypothetical protein
VTEEVAVDLAAPDTEPSVAPTDPEQVRDLAEQLRSQGVVVVASRALAAARPEGIDLLGALPVLTREIAQEWLEAADSLPVLDVDRLQVRSASALLGQAAATAAADAIRVDALDGASVARAASLRSALRSPEEPNLLLDRTWAVLCDLRRLAANGSGAATDGPRNPAVVPSATVVSIDEARSLPPALNRAASAGALVGVLAPWLPSAHVDALAEVDALLNAVSAMARATHDTSWVSALTTVGRVAASLSVAAAYAAAGYAGSPARATALTLSEPALGLLVGQAAKAAAAVVPAAAVPENPRGEDEARTLPQASPSQQARAAAERAAAERRATQQAFMERAQATRAAARQEPVAEPEPAAPTEVHSDLLHTAPHGLPSLAQVQADLGEAGEDEEIDLGVWDTLMRPR